LPLAHLVRNSAAARDVRVIKALRSLELKVFVAWECHLEASVDIALSRLEELIEVCKVHE
jgi:G:T-mismatch repair DNA endonuclease (very short patch repair protein)